MSFHGTMIEYEEGTEKFRTVCYDAISVKLPGSNDRLFMVVVKGFGKKPMMLLSNCRSSWQLKRVSGGL